MREWTRGVSLVLAALAACTPELTAPPAGTEATRPAPVGSSPGDAEPYLGTQRLTVLLVNTDTITNYTDELFVENSNLIVSEFEHFMGVNAAGRLQFSIQTVGPLHLSPSLCVVSDPTYETTQRQLLEAAALAADSAVDFSLSHQIVVIHVGGGACPSGASGYPRKLWGAITAEGQLDASLTFVPGGRAAPYSAGMVHELGHTIGATHGEPIICTAEGVRLFVDHSPHAEHATLCAIGSPYQTSLDPMSYGMYHFSAPHKIRWGWIAPGEVTTVVAGTYLLYPTEGPFHGTRAKALRLPIKSHFYHSLVLEYRSSKLPVASGWEFQQEPGVYLYADRSYAGSALADLLEPLDANSSLTEFATRPLPIGVPVEDRFARVTIRVLQISEGAAKIMVTRTPPP